MDINLVLAMQEVSSKGFTSSAHKAQRKSKDLAPITTKAIAISRELEVRLEGEATVICPITGLIVPSGLPSTGNSFLVCAHPMVFNAFAIAEDTNYPAKLSDEQTCGLILALLHTLGKVSIDPNSSAFAINLRMRGIYSRKELDEFLDWVFGNLGHTNAYYPPISLSHFALNPSTLRDYTNWVAALSMDFYSSAIETRTIKAVTAPTETQVKRMDSAAYDEWLDMASRITLPKAFVEKAKPFIKKLISTPSQDTIDRICSKVEALAKDEASTVNPENYNSVCAVGELFTLEIMEMRKKADKLGYYKAQLDEWDTPATVLTEVVNETPSQVETVVEQVVQPKKVNFLDLLKAKQEK